MIDVMGRRQFALTMFYGGASEEEIRAELWIRDWRVPRYMHALGVSTFFAVYGSVALAAVLLVRWIT